MTRYVYSRPALWFWRTVDYLATPLVGVAVLVASSYAAYSLGYSEGAHREHVRAVLREAAMLDRDACAHERNQINAWCQDELRTQRVMFSHVICPAGADAALPRRRR